MCKFMTRYGVPNAMITDNEMQFMSRVFNKFLQKLGVRHQLTVPYNPRERSNKTVRNNGSAVDRMWDEKWPEPKLAVNTSVAETIGYSPAFIA